MSLYNNNENCAIVKKSVKNHKIDNYKRCAIDNKSDKVTKKANFKQSVNWCFTDFELLDWENIFNSNKDKIRYLCKGVETCPSTGKKHIQGWIQFHTKKRLGGVKLIINSKKIHLESCRGDEFDNEKYCKKDNEFKTWGSFITQGYRSDLKRIYDEMMSGKPIADVIRDDINVYSKYRNTFKDIKQIYDKESSKEFRKVEVIMLRGSTGTGKTKHAMKEATYKINASELNWWDGYDGDKAILIDEYDNDVPITKMLNILDGYQLRLPIKGGFTYAKWNKVYITTNLETEQLHAHAKFEHRNALFRRINKLYNVEQNGKLINVTNEIRNKETNIKNYTKRAEVVNKGNTIDFIDQIFEI